MHLVLIQDFISLRFECVCDDNLFLAYEYLLTLSFTQVSVSCE